VNDDSRYTWTIMFHNKSLVRNHIINFLAFFETQFNTKVKIIRTDNGDEFLICMISLLPKASHTKLLV